MNEVFTANERLHIERAKEIIRKELRLHIEALPISYYELFKTSILTGGAIGSILRAETPNDWDMYLAVPNCGKFLDRVIENKDNIQDCILELPHQYTSSHVNGKYVTAYATTFKNKLQVITGFNKEHRLEFDFVHCMPYFDMETQKLHISKQQYKACLEKMLIKNDRVQKAPGEMWTPKKRLEKFLDNGWKLDIR